MSSHSSAGRRQIQRLLEVRHVVAPSEEWSITNRPTCQRLKYWGEIQHKISRICNEANFTLGYMKKLDTTWYFA